MRIRSRFSVLTLVLLVATFCSPVCYSQSENSQSTTPVDIPMEKIVKYLRSDIFIKPGRGLKAVKLGMSYQDVMKAWGKPDKSRRAGAFSRSIEWMYLAGDGTEILLGGGKAIGSISIRGKMHSIYETTEGARFGMPTYAITSIYGRPQEGVKENTMDYPDKGIKFHFKNNRVHIITVKPQAQN